MVLDWLFTQCVPPHTAQGPAGVGCAVGAGSSAALSREQKAKLLWGHKRDAAAAGVVPATGNNRWEAAEFDDTQQKVKFQRLMGAHHHQAPEPGSTGHSQQQLGTRAGCNLSEQQQQPGGSDDVDASAPRVMDKQQQAKVLSDVERQFIQGLRRADGRTVGLGL